MIAIIKPVALTAGFGAAFTIISSYLFLWFANLLYAFSAPYYQFWLYLFWSDADHRTTSCLFWSAVIAAAIVGLPIFFFMVSRRESRPGI